MTQEQPRQENSQDRKTAKTGNSQGRKTAKTGNSQGRKTAKTGNSQTYYNVKRKDSVIKMTTNSHRFMKSGFAIVVLLLLLGGAAFAASKLGGRCSYSRDCIEGYCLNSTCRYPPVLEKFDVFGNCSYTSDCGDGFCKDGQCIIPVVEEFDIFTPAAGIKSGCAGFIENCSGIWCMFCNVTWILLVVGAGAAAFVSRKRGRMLPVFMFLLPVIAGVLFYPVAGFILAVLEIFIIAFLKKPMERIEVSAAELGPKGPGPGFPKGGTPPLGGTPPTSGIPPSSGSFG